MLILGFWFAGLAMTATFEPRIIRKLGTNGTGRVTKVFRNGRSKDPNEYCVEFSFPHGYTTGLLNTADARLPKVGDPIAIVTAPFAILERAVLRDGHESPAIGALCFCLFAAFWWGFAVIWSMVVWLVPWRDARHT